MAMRSTETPIDDETPTDEPAPTDERVSSDELVLALREASQALQQFLTAQAHASDLGMNDLCTLIRAADGEGVTPIDAGRALGLTRGSMTPLADRLETRRLIRRAPYPNDRRLLLLKATPQGHGLLDRTLGPLLAQLVELADALEPEVRSELTAFIKQSTTALLIEQAGAAGRGNKVRDPSVNGRGG